MNMNANMKKKLLFLSSIFFTIILTSTAFIKIFAAPADSDYKKTIATSFYPVYVITQNLVDGIFDLNVVNITSNTSGCLHDYQLTSSDMKTLQNCNMLIINGAGMEGFVDDIRSSNKSLKIIDSSQGIELLEGYGCSHNHTHSESENSPTNDTTSHIHDDECIDDCNLHVHDENCTDDSNSHIHDENCTDDCNLHVHDENCTNDYNLHVHDENCTNDCNLHTHVNNDTNNYSSNAHTDDCSYNSHIWLNTKTYSAQINNIYNALLEEYPEYKQQLSSNLAIYLAKVNKLSSAFKSLNFPENTEILIFHDSFAYLADDLNLTIGKCVNIDGESSLSAGEIADCINYVNEHNIKFIFTEEQFGVTIANKIAAETNAKVVIIDTLVSGSNSKDSYINGMESNIKVLKQALASYK